MTRTLLSRVLVVLVLALLLGLTANVVSPRAIPWFAVWSDYVTDKAREERIHVVDLATTRRLVQGGSCLIFDARPLKDYDEGHIPTAMSLPYMEVEETFPQYEMLLTPEQPILVYCSGKECDESLLLSIFLRDQGVTNLMLFVDGYGAWREAETGGGRRP